MKPVQACLFVAAFLLLPALHYGLVWRGLPLAAALVIALAAIAQALAYSVVLAVFARSLRTSRTPLIAQLACLTRGTLPSELVHYTRQVTIAWCWFCLAQIVTPLLLWAVAPPLVLVETALNLPLVAAMVAGEYSYRLIRYRHIRHESPGDMVRLVKQFRGLVIKPAKS